MFRPAGRFPALPDTDAIAAATGSAPADTRASVRGRWIAERPASVLAATWDSLLLRDDHGVLCPLPLPDPFHPGVAPGAEPASLATLIRAEQAALAGEEES